MQKKRWFVFLVLLCIVLQAGFLTPAYAEQQEGGNEEEVSFENKAHVSFFDERGGLPPKEFVVNIVERQEGSGVPSPNNQCPIIGYTACSIMHSDEDISRPTVFSVTFPEEAGIVCGGAYDVMNGILVVTRAAKVVRGLEDLGSVNIDRRLVMVDLPGISLNSLNTPEELDSLHCDRFYTLETSATWNDENLFVSKTGGGGDVAIRYEEVFTSEESIDRWFAANPTTISYELEEPLVFSVDAPPLFSYEGANVFWTDTGKIRSFVSRTLRPLSEAVRPALRILVFGNSFTYNTLDYVPALLEEILPETEIVMGICYDGACTLERHIIKFNGGDEESEIPAEYSRYSEYRTSVGHWASVADEYTPQMALDRQDWDVIVLQQSVENLHSFDELSAYCELLLGYLSSPVNFVYNMAQARHPGDTGWLIDSVEGVTGMERSNSHFQAIADYAQRALETPYISAVLPCATAVQNLRTLPFAADCGELGYFSKDDGGHLQEGIAPLAAGYAAAYQIAAMCGESPKLYGLTLMPTDEWMKETNIPSRISNGPCVGVSRENLVLAQKCAMMAVKHPFEITDFSGTEE